MDDETLILMPLEDEPLPGNAPAAPLTMASMEEQPDIELHNWRTQVLAHADKEGYAILPYPEVIAALEKATPNTFDFLMENGWRVSDLLHKVGLVAAPDNFLERFRLKLTDKVVLYASDEDAPIIRTRQYKKGMIFLKFATLAFTAMTPQELEVVEATIDHYVKAPRYRKHLRGMLRWYNERRRLLDSRTKRIASEILTEVDRVTMANGLLDIAAMQGAALTPRSVHQLDRLLQLLGHGPGEVHSLLHRHHVGQGFTATPTTGELLPVKIDTQALRDIEKETKEVQSLLAEVFEKEEEPQKASGPQLPPLLIPLLEKEEWDMAEVEALCQKLGLKPMAALEAVNDYASEKLGDTIADLDGSTLYVTTDYRDALSLSVRPSE
ncbi:MAG: hypothetical protein LIP03_01540 [Bacteroidales bacterium]|nr:hypothetical protein [Bacteroidales bacterium]